MRFPSWSGPFVMISGAVRLVGVGLTLTVLAG
jgi:hypothetical protein